MQILLSCALQAEIFAHQNDLDAVGVHGKARDDDLRAAALGADAVGAAAGRVAGGLDVEALEIRGRGDMARAGDGIVDTSTIRWS